MMPTELISDTSHSGGKKRILNRVLRRTLSSQPARLAAGFALCLGGSDAWQRLFN